MWVTKLLIFPVEIRIFCPKTTKFGPKLAFLVNLGQAMQAYSMSCCGSVGGCCSRAVSRKTPIYFIIIFLMVNVQVQEKRGDEIGEAVEKQTKLASARSFWQQRPEKPFLLPDCGERLVQFGICTFSEYCQSSLLKLPSHRNHNYRISYTWTAANPTKI